jgi:D-arginine dehydrogenase
MPATTQFEAVIIGGGIAGASLAYFLTQRGMREVLLLERERQPGYHATGRSAAVLVEWDPVPALQALKIQAAPFLRDPPDGFSEQPLLEQTGILVLFREPAWSAVAPLLSALAERGTHAVALSRDEVLARVPLLAPDSCDGGVLLPRDGHLDVHELLWSYLRQARRHGMEHRWNADVREIQVADGRVQGVVTSAGTFAARWVVNAAGAWARPIGALAGADLPLVPHRRTIITFAAPDGTDVRQWPLVNSDAHGLYFGPESSGLLASPMDEEPSEPCDAHPDAMVVAETIERLRSIAPALVPKTLRRTWAGLRTFAPDRVLVIGEDPRVRGLFWLAGQGGCGIETSPATGEIAADLLLDGRTDRFDAATLSPARLL